MKLFFLAIAVLFLTLPSFGAPADSRTKGKTPQTSASSAYMTAQDAQAVIKLASDYFFSNLNVVKGELILDSISIKIIDSHDYDDNFDNATVDVSWFQYENKVLFKCLWSLDVQPNLAESFYDPQCTSLAN